MEVTIRISDSELKTYLKNMGERQLLSLLLEVLSDRNPKKASACPLQLCIEDEEGEGFYLIADGGENWADDATLCQFGRCCHPLVSWAKNADCPICKKEVYLS